jgi:DNA-binding transcriptional LysR family regulator
VAFEFIAPMVRLVRERYPDIRIELLTSVHFLDLARGEADVALRMRHRSSSDLAVVGSLRLQSFVLASPSYAARLPARPRLRDLDWIAWAPPFEDISPNPELAALVPGFRPVFTSDSYIVQTRACEAGVGAMIGVRCPNRHARPSSLVPLDITLGAGFCLPLHLVCAKSALGVPRIRVVAELLAEELAATAATLATPPLAEVASAAE